MYLIFILAINFSNGSLRKHSIISNKSKYAFLRPSAIFSDEINHLLDTDDDVIIELEFYDEEEENDVVMNESDVRSSGEKKSIADKINGAEASKGKNTFGFIFGFISIRIYVQNFPHTHCNK